MAKCLKVLLWLWTWRQLVWNQRKSRYYIEANIWQCGNIIITETNKCKTSAWHNHYHTWLWTVNREKIMNVKQGCVVLLNSFLVSLLTPVWIIIRHKRYRYVKHRIHPDVVSLRNATYGKWLTDSFIRSEAIIYEVKGTKMN